MTAGRGETLSGAAAPTRLRCENNVDPLGIDALQPRLSWQLSDGRRGVRQTAYELQVASSGDGLARGEADRWSTGRVEAADSLVVYDGAPLGSRDGCWWRVRTWDADGAATPWSDAAHFEVGLVRPFNFPAYSDWRATLIRSAVVGTRTDGVPAPFMRRQFTVPGDVVSARLYITAQGLYEAWINGRRVGHDRHRPGWTDYRIRLPYQTHDVTDLVANGDNAIGAILGDGWFCGHVAIAGGRQGYGDRPGLFAQLEIEVAGEDERLVIATDADWLTTTGPILSSDNYLGEHHDARLELPGWSEAGMDTTAWEPVQLGAPILAGLVATVAPPVRAVAELRPVAQWESAPGVHVFDLGQNMVGHVRLRVAGAPAGTTIQLRHAEVLDADGRTIWTANLHRAIATDSYTCRGDAVETWEPRFTFHGFRYVEVTGHPGTPSLDDVTGVVVHSAMTPTGEFECSNALISRLYQNIVWSWRGNSVDLPTDCPQRYERLGWTGDIAMFARTAVFLEDAQEFLRKWIHDLIDSQIVGGVEDGQFPTVAPRSSRWGGGPAWADAAVFVPWALYTAYGDTTTLTEIYPALQRWMGYLAREEAGRAPGSWIGFGDWVSLDTDPDNPLGPDDRWGGTSLAFLRDAFRAHATDLVGRIADVIGRRHDAAEWFEVADRRRRAFVTAHVVDGRLAEPTQTGCTLALTFDLLPDAASRQAVGEDLAKDVESRGHLVTGFVGTPWLLHALERAGRLDLAYQLIEREELPGWLYPVTQGATTMWERWDAWTPERGFHPSGMNSFNHYAYGAVGHWLHRTIGGLDIDDERPGSGRLRIAPRPGGSIRSGRAALQTTSGAASCAWELADGRMQLAFTIPPNRSATVLLPARSTHAVVGSLADVDGVSDLRSVDGFVAFEAAAGSYELTIADPVVA